MRPAVMLMVFVWALCFLSALTCVASRVCIYIYVRMHVLVCIPMGNTYRASLLGTWSCNSLSSARLLDLAAPSSQHSNSYLPENLTYRLVSAEWLFACLLSFYSDNSFLSCLFPPVLR